MTNYNEAVEQLETVIDCVRFACSEMDRANVYFGHGTDNAWDEAVALVFHAINMPQELGKNVLLARLLKSERRAIFDLLLKRVQLHTPLSYLTNHTRYCGLDFYVDERVLIPRSPIAELIEQQFSPWVDPKNVMNVLELCTGSGCISIAMAYAFPDAHITATDISLDALEVAGMNVESHELEERVHLMASDVYHNVPVTQYDLIVSNPPYVCDDEMEALPEEYNQEPSLALQADDNGLAIVERILRGANKRLSEEGVLVVEVGSSEYALQEKYPMVPFTWLEFERGGSGVFLLNKAQLQQHF